MFSGIVEEAAEVVALREEGSNLHITMRCSFADELTIDQSVAHNGVCLTVVALPGDGTYTVTAIRETLDRSNLGDLKPGDLVNLERSMKMNGRLDGHIVQGHVDQTAVCTDVREADGSWYYTFEYESDKELARKGYITVDKGSVTVNGVSLTVCEPTDNSFKVAIIPYTHDNTNFHRIEKGTKVNIEFDILGKYLARIMTTQQ
ncbi:riboflavin synthase [Muribaculaceae bacterium Isolate-113 (HZI)]|jgi:riboflavin synthase|uniref:riboflavin synthase n=1 Tax=Bacteroidales TaxID=171549 RepID=UPI000E9BEEE8|nr:MULTISPECIES: riboflavin synthase [Bacteroidales]MBJ2191871.1 riboflavin synthase [Muribaculaceae bacterium]ROS84630.1 riboflavin synthase [Muribaculaceae bacterium Isolate-036 (Harlan)]ROT19938.1 riboflavin synthase [Muribaculaceae bacterium Isolate-114 (HZI)]ROT21871.1 riboflavin synthase [Muribaculaceae bacterium Isolate-113 (HZI)]RXE68532.1 riboflavin synthase [Muribaculaceae bacterium Isolate-001 (NCI)]HBY16035.1 riboflavin synthase [Porphyromonadaceae bacterium]